MCNKKCKGCDCDKVLEDYEMSSRTITESDMMQELQDYVTDLSAIESVDLYNMISGSSLTVNDIKWDE